MIGLPSGEKNYDDVLSRFHLVPERNRRTDWRKDGQTYLLYQYRASVCSRAIKSVIVGLIIEAVELRQVTNIIVTGDAWDTPCTGVAASTTQLWHVALLWVSAVIHSREGFMNMQTSLSVAGESLQPSLPRLNI